MSDGKQWYTNKDLFEKIQGLSKEMEQTRNMIRQYNGLREEVGKAREEILEVKEEVETLQAKAAGRSSVWNDIRVWGSWIITLGSLLFAALTFLLHMH